MNVVHGFCSNPELKTKQNTERKIEYHFKYLKIICMFIILQRIIIYLIPVSNVSRISKLNMIWFPSAEGKQLMHIV